MTELSHTYTFLAKIVHGSFEWKYVFC